MASSWLLDEVSRKIGVDGSVSAGDFGLYTRALMPSPIAKVDPPPAEHTFEWVKVPESSDVQVTSYVDGSRLDAEHDLYGFCARQGWAIAAYDDKDELVMAAHGRTPFWADGIHATELWGLLMAVQTCDPGSS